MDFEIVRQADERRVSLVAIPGEYDARPLIDRVRMEALPLGLHPDRLAAATCLLFGRQASGAFRLPGDGCAPHVANAIEAFISPTEVHVYPVNCVASRVPLGQGRLGIDARSSGLAAEKAPGRSVLAIRGMGEAVGMIATDGWVEFASNASLLSIAAGSDLQRALPAIGVAVLFCEDMQIGCIELPAKLAEAEGDESATLAEKLRVVLDSVGIRIAWV